MNGARTPGTASADSAAARLVARRRGMRELLLVTERLHKTLHGSVAELLAREDLNVTQWLIVSDIAAGHGHTLTDFSRWLERDPGSLSRAIHRLIVRALLDSRRRPGDRRSTELQLTPDGHALVARLSPQLDQLAGTLEHSLSSMPLDALAGQVELALSRLQEQRRALLRPPPR